MTLFTSGDWHVDCERILTFDIFDYMCKRFDKLKGQTIEVNQVDLSTDNAFGFCQYDGICYLKSSFVSPAMMSSRSRRRRPPLPIAASASGGNGDGARRPAHAGRTADWLAAPDEPRRTAPSSRRF